MVGNSAKLGAIIHFDLIVNDTEEAEQYYEGAAAWGIGEGTPNYKPVSPASGGPTGGLWKRPGVQQRLLTYFEVESVEAFNSDEVIAAECTIIETDVHPGTQVPYSVARHHATDILFGVMQATT